MAARRRTPSARVDLVRQAAAANRGLTVLTAALVVVAGLLPAAFSLATGALAGAVPGAVGRGLSSGPGHHVAAALLAATAAYVAIQVIGPLRAVVADTLMRSVDEALSTRLMRAVSGPRGIAHLEDPAVLDQVAQAQGAVTGNTAGAALTSLAN